MKKKEFAKSSRGGSRLPRVLERRRVLGRRGSVKLGLGWVGRKKKIAYLMKKLSGGRAWRGDM